jgi:hypothetical protein
MDLPGLHQSRRSHIGAVSPAPIDDIGASISTVPGQAPSMTSPTSPCRATTSTIIASAVTS